jgi:outer membrane protein W
MTGVFASASASDLTGNACVGFRGGLAQFTSGLNYDRTKSIDPGSGKVTLFDKSISPRLSGDLAFGYVWSDHITLDLWTSWAWSRFKSNAPGATDSYYVATSIPVLLGARFLARDGHPWRPYVGAGGGIYWWSVLSKDLGAAKDPVTFERLRKGVPGLYGTLGVERRFSKYITGTGDVVYHHLFGEDLEDFPSGFNGSKSYVQIRAGVNFYFSVSERIESGFPE